MIILLVSFLEFLLKKPEAHLEVVMYGVVRVVLRETMVHHLRGDVVEVATGMQQLF